MTKRIGLYGGTFNPIHFGHLNLAIEMLEKQELSQILFCPAALNPHKTKNDLIHSKHRVEMIKLAISDVPQFRLLENELKRGTTPSYTIDTVEELLSLEVESERPQYFLILGNDSIYSFQHWHRVHELVALIPLLIGSRPTENTVLDPLLEQALLLGMTQTRVMDISSTEIRLRLEGKKYCGHLLPSKVLDYIYKNRLYYVS